MVMSAPLLARTLVALFLAGLPGVASAGNLVVTYHHGGDSLTADLGGKDLRWRGESVLRVSPGTRVSIRVARTNTALYKYKLAVAEQRVAELDALKQVSSAMSPYLLEMLQGVSPLGPPAAAIAPPSPVELERELTAVAQCAAELRRIEIEALVTLDAMPAGIPDAARVLGYQAATDSLLESDGVRLKVGRRLLSRLAQLSDLVSEYGGPEEARTARPEPLARMVERARRVLDGSQRQIEQLLRVENLVAAVRQAKPEWVVDLGRLPTTRSRIVKLVVAPQSSSLAEGLARQPERVAEFEVKPSWWIQPYVSAGLLYSPDSRFTTYAVDLSGATPVVVATGTEDARFTYGLALALAPRGWDRLPRGFGIWPVELTVNPSEGVRAIGLGSAVSWGFLKASLGGLWTRHQTATTTSVEETYGEANFFFAVSLGAVLD